MKKRLSLLAAMPLLFACYPILQAQSSWVEDAAFGFKIQVPDTYQRNAYMEGTDKVHAFLSPDQNLAVRVRVIPFEGSGTVTSQQVAQLWSQNILVGANELGSQADQVNGLQGTVHAYRWNYNNIQCVVAAFVTVQPGKAYVLWTLLPEHLYQSRVGESDAITNTFQLIRNQGLGGGLLGGMGGPAQSQQQPAQSATPPRQPVQQPVQSQQPVQPPLPPQQTMPPQVQSPPATMPPSRAPAPGGTAAAVSTGNYLTMVVEDSYFEFDYPAAFQRQQISEGMSQWWDPNAGDDKIKMVVQTMLRSAGNTGESVAAGILRDVDASPAATLLATGNRPDIAIPVQTISFELEQAISVLRFDYAIIDLPGPHVAAISFLGPSERRGELMAHRDRLITSLKSTWQTDSESTTTVSTAGTPAMAGPVPGGQAIPSTGNTAATSRGAWEAMNDAAHVGNWNALVQHLDPDAVQKFTLPTLEQLCRERGIDLSAYPVEPLARLKELLQKQELARNFISGWGLPGEIFNIREENDSMHLIMFRANKGGEIYFWMKKINGKWVFSPN